MLDFAFALLFLALVGAFFYCLSCLFYPWGGLRSRAHALWGVAATFAAQIAVAAALPPELPAGAGKQAALDFRFYERCLDRALVGKYGSVGACQTDAAWGWAAAIEAMSRQDASPPQGWPALGPLGRAVYRAALAADGSGDAFLFLEVCRDGYAEKEERSFWVCAKNNAAAWTQARQAALSPLTLAEAEDADREAHAHFSETNWRVYRAAFTGVRAGETAQERVLREAKLDKMERERKRDRNCRDDKAGAYVGVRIAVSKRLKAPETAKFPWAWAEHMDYAAPCEYTVRSFVDVENGEGAVARTHFTATVAFIESDEWRVHRLRWD